MIVELFSLLVARLLVDMPGNNGPADRARIRRVGQTQGPVAKVWAITPCCCQRRRMYVDGARKQNGPGMSAEGMH